MRGSSNEPSCEASILIAMNVRLANDLDTPSLSGESLGSTPGKRGFAVPRIRGKS